MSDTWIVNASPIIVLAKAGLERLLIQLSGEVLVPDAVAAEILAGPETDPARTLLESGWARIISPTSMPTSVVEWGLGPGESAVIALGLETENCMVVLDDALGRSCARTFGLRLLGTLGVILKAKQQDVVPSAADALAALRSHGFYLNDAVIRAALESVGEDWDSG